MNVIETGLAGALVFEPKVWGDPRGYFKEIFNQKRYAEHGLPSEWSQDNVSFSTRGILRGMHYQSPNAQSKLVQVLEGAVYDVIVDLRADSPTLGKWFGVELTGENHRQLWVPRGFAHGFVVTGEHAIFCYKCSGYYEPATEHTLLWNDPEVGIHWPLADVRLSDKDLVGKPLRDLEATFYRGS